MFSRFVSSDIFIVKRLVCFVPVLLGSAYQLIELKTSFLGQGDCYRGTFGGESCQD